MNNQIMLAQATPPGGIILRVRNQPGSLLGATIQGIDGPNVTLEFSVNGTTGWSAFPPPITLNQETYLRLTRTDESSAISTIRLTVPVGVAGSLDGDGHLVIEGLAPVATGDALDALTGRVTTLEQTGGGGGGGPAGPVVLSQGEGADTYGLTGSTTPTNRAMRRLSIRAQSLPLQLISQILIDAQVPPGAVQLIGMYDQDGNPLYEGTPIEAVTDFLGTTITIPPLLYGNPGDELVVIFNADVTAPFYPVTQTSQQILRTSASDQFNASLSGLVRVQLTAATAGVLAGPITHYSLPIVRVPTVNPPRAGYWEVVDNGGGAPRIRYSDGYNWYNTLLTAE